MEAEAIRQCFCRVLLNIQDLQNSVRSKIDYCADPSSHLRRRAATTSSCGITRPASLSARPRLIACTTYRW